MDKINYNALNRIVGVLKGSWDRGLTIALFGRDFWLVRVCKDISDWSGGGGED